MIEKSAQQRDNFFKNDASRPIYHFLPPANWMNDPNGFIQWNGQYHLFYQYNPLGAYHANMHWGHAVSDNLVHWRDLPVALAPTPGTVDEGGIFSGCAINHDDVPTIFYTGVSTDYDIQVQCMATGDDDLTTWQKHADNPIIDTVPADAKQTTEFRDPFVWKEDETWYMVVGSQIADRGGVVFLYQSNDLINWTYLHPLYADPEIDPGAVWECPNFFKLGDKWILIISQNNHDVTTTVYYFVGTFENQQFTPEYRGVLDHAYLYAPLTTVDDEGRRLLMGWIREGRSDEAHREAGWAGVQCVPRNLTLDEQNRLLTDPVPEIETIRKNGQHFSDLELSGDADITAQGLNLDISAEIDCGTEGQFSLWIACSEDGSTGTVIQYDARSQHLTLNTEKSSDSDSDDRKIHTIEHPLDEDELLQLRILMDGSVIELIANKRTSITGRIYPVRFGGNFLRLSGNDTIVRQLDIYEMPSIWSNETG